MPLDLNDVDHRHRIGEVKPSSSSLSRSSIIAIAVSVTIVALILVGGLVFFLLRRRKTKEKGGYAKMGGEKGSSNIAGGGLLTFKLGRSREGEEMGDGYESYRVKSVHNEAGRQGNAEETRDEGHEVRRALSVGSQHSTATAPPAYRAAVGGTVGQDAMARDPPQQGATLMPRARDDSDNVSTRSHASRLSVSRFREEDLDL